MLGRNNERELHLNDEVMVMSQSSTGADRADMALGVSAIAAQHIASHFTNLPVEIKENIYEHVLRMEGYFDRLLCAAPQRYNEVNTRLPSCDPSVCLPH